MAPSTYYAAKKRRVTPSARAVRDAAVMQILLTLWVANRRVYGAHKLWKAVRRAGHDIGRDQVARLMRQLDIEGVSRLRKKVFTTKADPDATRAPDLVNRLFTAKRPDALWVTDLTYVPTRSEMAYVCFIVDAFSRRIVGWRVAANMKTEMVLDALEMARTSRGGHRLIGLVTHSDAGSQGGFNWPSQHLDREVEAWSVVSVRSRHALGRIEVRSRRRGRRRWPGVRIGSGSGPLSPAAPGLKTHAVHRACRGRLGFAGFVTLAA